MRATAHKTTVAAARPVPAKLRVLGLDPAAAGPTGYGVVETDGRRCRVLGFGTVRANGAERRDPVARLNAIHTAVAALVERFAPDVVAVESVFTALNMRTALQLAEVRGVVLLAAAQSRLPVHSYSPREVKAIVAGYGHAGKPQMQQMVRALLGMAELPQPADAADALAVALCHIQSVEARARFLAATGLEPPAGKRPCPERSRGAGKRHCPERNRGARSRAAAPRIQPVR